MLHVSYKHRVGVNPHRIRAKLWGGVWGTSVICIALMYFEFLFPSAAALLRWALEAAVVSFLDGREEERGAVVRVKPLTYFPFLFPSSSLTDIIKMPLIGTSHSLVHNWRFPDICRNSHICSYTEYKFNARSESTPSKKHFYKIL